jgi:uncharacterized membrane protein YccF (DUF307 family)
MRTLGNILWFVLAGVWLAMANVVAGVKMVPLAFAPFGKEVVKIGAVTTTDALVVPRLG